MYKKYLLKSFNPQTFDCAHLAALFIRNELGIDTNGMDLVSRKYNPSEAGKCIYEGMLQNGMIEVNDGHQKGDVLIYYNENNCGCCAVCIDDKIALIMRRKSMAIHINRLLNIKHHLRHKSLLKE